MEKIFNKKISLLALPISAMAILAVFLLSGCGQADEGLNANVNFPEFVYRSEGALEGYKLAVAYKDEMQFTPCYCGCKRDAEKYQSLKDCFISRQTGDFDEHAAGCSICLEEARDIGQWKKEGLFTREIRERIDAQYAERGEPTDTPLPVD